MFTPFFTIAFGTLISEDLTCIATGALIAQGTLGFWNGALACLFGIFSGDVLLFLAGRWIGRSASRFISPDKLERGSQWLSKKGPVVILVSRFTPGLRTATYFAAGALRTRFWSFALYFLLASILWTPLVIGLTVLAGAGFVRHRNQAVVAFAIAATMLYLIRSLLNFERRRKLVGAWKRLARWEFWPAWAAYLPFAPYFAYLALRYRSATLFTAANPGIPSAGLSGESKSEILAQLDQTAEFGLIPASLEPYARLRAAAQIMGDLSLSFPVVVKPDVGERGTGVAVVRSTEELHRRLQKPSGDLILQRYIDGLEFGVFYYRYPSETRGRILSITEKRFPEVLGDGCSTLGNLILRDNRAVCLAATYARLSKRSMDDIPAEGENVKLVEIGSHCRGSIFLDARGLKTEALENAVDRVSQSHGGFYFGRFDVRTPSIEAFQQGIFTVLELNGVAAEAAHIYDPAVSLLDAYRSLFLQWRIAFEIGRQNQARGARPMSMRELASLILGRVQRQPRQDPLTVESAG